MVRTWLPLTKVTLEHLVTTPRAVRKDLCEDFNILLLEVRGICCNICHGFVSAGDALGRERPATSMLSFLAGRSGCK